MKILKNIRDNLPILKSFSCLLLVVFVLSSCGEGCYEADEFDDKPTFVKANPQDTDGVDGNYESDQKAEWHNTGYVSNGKQFIIKISGGWSPWFADNINENNFKYLEECHLCTKKDYSLTGGKPADASDNCVCAYGQIPQREFDQTTNSFVNTTDGSPVNCTGNLNHQNDPKLCTCTTTIGNAMDYTLYHIPLNYYNKDGTEKGPEFQSVCKYIKGMGLYLGLFGVSGYEIPLRGYHLFSNVQPSCSVPLNRQGKCVDANGNDMSSYIFRSVRDNIFVSDDLQANNGSDMNLQDDKFHKPNEVVKVIILDDYYSDNYGGYRINFLQGVVQKGRVGLFEKIVAMFEAVILGDIEPDGKRNQNGGILKFLYNSLVQNPSFIAILNVALICYITFYGVGILIGVAEISRKEILNLILKITFILLFVNKAGWNFYNNYLVTFFKGGMDNLISMILGYSDASYMSGGRNGGPSDIIVAQMTRSSGESFATRFSFVDTIFDKLFSEGATAKIFGLFFADIFGWLYIILIYGLIFFFLYVMLKAAFFYITNLMNIIFGIAIGPIFFVLLLFEKTKGFFKRWISFVATSSLNVMLLFMVLYNFLLVIDSNFTQLLSYRVCYKDMIWGGGVIGLTVPISEVENIGVGDFISKIILLLLLIKITEMMMEKISTLSRGLIVISDNKGDKVASPAMKSMNNMMNASSKAFGAAASAVKSGLGKAGGLAAAGLTAAVRATGVADKFNAIGDKIADNTPLHRGPRTYMRDKIIKESIKKNKKKHPSDSPQELRHRVIKDMHEEMYKNPNNSRILGLDMTNISKALDYELERKPLDKFVKERAKLLKNEKKLYGKNLQEQLKRDAEEWAKKNTLGGKNAVDKYFEQNAKKVNAMSDLSAKKAANFFSDNKNKQKEYLEYLKDKETEQKFKMNEKNGFAKSLYLKARSRMSDRYDATSQARDFSRMIDIGDKKSNSAFRGLGMQSPGELFYNNRSPESLARIEREQERVGMEIAKSYFTEGKFENQKNAIDRRYSDKITNAGNYQERQKWIAKRDRDLEKLSYKYDQYKDEYKHLVVKEAQEKIEKVQKEKGLEEANKLRADMAEKAREDYEKSQREHLLKIRDAVTEKDDNKREEKIKAMGGVKTARDGLSIGEDGKTLFEKEILFRHLNGMDIDATPERRGLDTFDFSSTSAAKTTESTSTEPATNTDDRENTVPKVENSSNSFVATEMKMEFGASITDALIKESDIGLKASNIALGVSTDELKKIDEKLVSYLEMDKNKLSTKIKTLEMEKKYKEYRIAELKSSKIDSEANKKEIEQLTYEISDISTKLVFENHEMNDVSSKIDGLKNSRN